MAEILTIDLKDHTPQGEGIEFVEAQMFADRPTPLVVVHYTSNGTFPDYGLRLDLQKRAFLDQPDDPKEAAFVRDAALPVAEFIANAVDRRHYGVLSTARNTEIVVSVPANDTLDESKIIAFLEELTPSDFNRVLVRLPGASHRIPEGVPHFTRVASLIEWLRSSSGPGVQRLREQLQLLFPRIAL